MTAKLLVALISSASVAHVLSHSWLECTDYRVTPGSADTKVWNPAQCFGHARCGKRQADEGFGVDTGLNFHSNSGCQCARGGDNYDGVKKAVYTPGQRVCLAYPSKNHVAAPCTNADIPDTGTVITRSPTGVSSDDDIAKEYSHSNGGHTNGQMDYKGFQNCLNFCSDMDKSLCTMCFDLEPDLAPGEYTFRWVWAFNSESDVYTTCWEADVRGGSSGDGDYQAGTVEAREEAVSPVVMSPTPSPDSSPETNAYESVGTQSIEGQEPTQNEEPDQPLEVDCKDEQNVSTPTGGDDETEASSPVEQDPEDCLEDLPIAQEHTEYTSVSEGPVIPHETQANSYPPENEEGLISQETKSNEPTYEDLAPTEPTPTVMDEYTDIAVDDIECEVGPDDLPEDGPGVVQAYPPP